MEHAVIPAPVRFDASDEGEFTFRPGTVVAYSDPRITSLAERFCAQFTRRTGIQVVAGRDAAAATPFVLIDLGFDADLDGLPGPAGLSPLGGDPADERYSLRIGAGQVVLRAAEPAGVARGLTTLTQLAVAGEGRLAAARIADGPRYAWRGLSLDVVRAAFTVEEIRRVIDLLELYKLNVLHLHLTDDEAWRLPWGRPAGPDAYREDELRELVRYAADRFVTIVPEVDTPGHATALLRLHPELSTGRNEVDYEVLPGHPRHATWLDPDLPATFGLLEQVLAQVAAVFPGPYLHIGADEPRGMPDELYVAYVRRLRRLVRALGRRPLGWQESARAGLEPEDVVQFWLTAFDLAADASPRARAQLDAELALARRDVEAIAAAAVPVIVSPLPYCYLDVPYAEPPADAAQADRYARLGLRGYGARTVAESFGWEPAEALRPGRAEQVAGIEAAIWGESVTSFGDLCFLLLPRLAGVAHRAWSTPHLTTWPVHRDRLARHGRLWAQDGLEYFRSSLVDWV